jgi:UDP-N-acetyl-D-galactosamine dehydrogenase
VPHRDYVALGARGLAGLVAPGGLFADLKNAVPEMDAVEGVRRWRI